MVETGIIGTLVDGRTIERRTTVAVVASGTVWVTLTLTNLTNIHALLEPMVESTSPKTSVGAFSHPTISGATIGITLASVGAGTTLTWSATALGT